STAAAPPPAGRSVHARKRAFATRGLVSVPRAALADRHLVDEPECLVVRDARGWLLRAQAQGRLGAAARVEARERLERTRTVPAEELEGARRLDAAEHPR